jgi:hypothetical protein
LYDYPASLLPPNRITEKPVIPSALHQDIEHVSLLIHRAPQIVAFTIDRQEDLVQVPLITWPGTPATELIRILLPELATPLPDGFVRHNDPTNEQEFFHITMAKREAKIQPDSVADDLPREPMMFIQIGADSGSHSSSSHGCEKSALLSRGAAWVN